MNPDDLRHASWAATEAFLAHVCSCGHPVRRHHGQMVTRGLWRCVDCKRDGDRLCLVRTSDLALPIRQAMQAEP